MAAPSGATPVLGLRYPVQNDDVDVPRDIQALAEDVENKGAFIIGEIRQFGFVNPPTRWLPCDGTTRAQAAYPELYGKIQTLWNTGGEAGTDFRLPGISGRVMVGPGTAVGGGIEASPPNRVVATKWGVNAVILSIAQMPVHAHSINDPGHSHTNTNGPYLEVSGQVSTWLNTENNSAYAVFHAPSTAVAATGIAIYNNGGGGSHENAPPSIVVPVFIYAGRV